MFQVVTAEILMASETGCPLEVHKISIDRCDEMFDEDCHGDTWMPFYRDDNELDLRSEIITQSIHFPSCVFQGQIRLRHGTESEQPQGTGAELQLQN